MKRYTNRQTGAGVRGCDDDDRGARGPAVTVNTLSSGNSMRLRLVGRHLLAWLVVCSAAALVPGAVLATDGDGDGWKITEGDKHKDEDTYGVCDGDASRYPGAIDICGEGDAAITNTYDQNCYEGDAVCDAGLPPCVDIYDKPLINKFSAPEPNVVFFIENTPSQWDHSSISPDNVPFFTVGFTHYRPFLDISTDVFRRFEDPYENQELLAISNQMPDVDALWYNQDDSYLPWPDETATWNWEAGTMANFIYPRQSEADRSYIPMKMWENFESGTEYPEAVTYACVLESSSEQNGPENVGTYFAYPLDVRPPHVRAHTSGRHMIATNPNIQSWYMIYGNNEAPEEQWPTLKTLEADALLVTPAHGSTINIKANLYDSGYFEYLSSVVPPIPDTWIAEGSILPTAELSNSKLSFIRMESVQLPPDYDKTNNRLKATGGAELSIFFKPLWEAVGTVSIWGEDVDDSEFINFFSWNDENKAPLSRFVESVSLGPVDWNFPFDRRVRSITKRNATDAVVSWTPNSADFAGDAQSTSASFRITVDVTDVVQEIIDRDGWVDGNAITFLLHASNQTHWDDGLEEQFDNYHSSEITLELRTENTDQPGRVYAQFFDYDGRSPGGRHDWRYSSWMTNPGNPSLMAEWAYSGGGYYTSRGGLGLSSPESGYTWLTDFPEDGFYHFYAYVPAYTNDPKGQYDIIDKDNNLLGVAEVQGDYRNFWQQKGRWVELVETAKLTAGANAGATTISVEGLLIDPPHRATFRIGDDPHLYKLRNSSTATSLDFRLADDNSQGLQAAYDAGTEIVFDQFWYFERSQRSRTKRTTSDVSYGDQRVSIENLGEVPARGSYFRFGDDATLYEIRIGSTETELLFTEAKREQLFRRGALRAYPSGTTITYYEPRRRHNIHQAHYLAWQTVAECRLDDPLEPLSLSVEKTANPYWWEAAGPPPEESLPEYDDGERWLEIHDNGVDLQVGDELMLDGLDYTIVTIEEDAPREGINRVWLENTLDEEMWIWEAPFYLPARDYDIFSIDQGEVDGDRHATKISCNTALEGEFAVEPGDFIKIGTMAGAYQLSPGTDQPGTAGGQKTLRVDHKYHALRTNVYYERAPVTILRPYLVVTDTHDIDGNPVNGGALTTQVYRWRDLDSFLEDTPANRAADSKSELEISEINLMYDYGELVRVDSTDITDGLLPRDDFLRSSVAVDASAAEVTSISVDRSDLEDYELEEKFFSPANSLQRYLVTSVDGDDTFSFLPPLQDDLAAGERIVFEDITFVRTPEEEIQNMANWLYYHQNIKDVTRSVMSTSIADSKGVNIGLFSYFDGQYYNHWQDTVFQVDGVRIVPQPVKHQDGRDKTKELLQALVDYQPSVAGAYGLNQALGDVGRYFDQTDSDPGQNMVATSDNDDPFYEAASADGNFPWSAGSNNPWYSLEDGGACQASATIAFISSGTKTYTNHNFSASAEYPTIRGLDAVNDDGDANTEYDGEDYGDESSYTIADVAMHYYERDLNTSLPDSSNVTSYDKNPAQKMRFYAVSYGKSYSPVSRNLDDRCPPNCVWPTISYDEWSGYYPDRSGNSFDAYHNKRVGWTFYPGDLFHATVNGRGEFLATASSSEVREGVQRFVDSIIEDGLSGASAGITSGRYLGAASQVFVSSFDSQYWTGDVEAYRLYTLEEYEVAAQPLEEGEYPDFVPGDMFPDPVWKASEINNDRDHSSRRVITFRSDDTTVSGIPFVAPADVFNPTATEISDYHLINDFERPPVDTGAELVTQALINYIRGSTEDEWPRGLSYRHRNQEFFGDFVNSTPLMYIPVNSVALNNFNDDGDDLEDEYGDPILDKDDNLIPLIDEPDEDPDIRLFIGGNDGGLHVLDTGGMEVLFYIPSLVYPNLKELSDPLYDHKFFVDGPLYLARLDDRNSATDPVSDPVLLVGGLGKGGKGYYALRVDEIVRDPTEDNAANIVAWEYPSKVTDDFGVPMTDDNNLMGYSYSPGYIVRSNDENTEWMVVFGNGYESDLGKAALIILGLNQDGSIKWRKELDTGIGDGANCNGLSTPALIDVNNDARVDFAFAGDLLGNMWKFDLRHGNYANWKIYFEEGGTGTPQPLFTAKGFYYDGTSWVSTVQPITTQPDVMAASCSYGQDGYMILFGTGRLLSVDEPFDQSPNSFYGIWDFSAAFDDFDPANASYDDAAYANNPGRRKYLGALDVPNPASPLDSRPLIANPRQSLLRQFVQYEGSNDFVTYRLTTKRSMDWYSPTVQNDEGHVGWYYELPAATERLVNDPFIVDGIVGFISTKLGAAICSDGFNSYIHALDACSGQRLDMPFFNINGDLALDSGDTIPIDLDEDISIPVSAVSEQGRLFNTGSRDLAGGGTQSMIFTGSRDKVSAKVTKAEELGITHWREIRD